MDFPFFFDFFEEVQGEESVEKEEDRASDSNYLVSLIF